jgi:signal transduction histidine kinase
MLIITILSLSIVGYLLFWNVRNILEDQFSAELLIISNYIKNKVDLNIVQFVEGFGQNNRTYNNYLEVLNELKEENKLRHLFIFNSNWESIFDTDSSVSYRQRYYDLYLDQKELSQVQDNSVITSDLYEDKFGNLFKRAYVKFSFKNSSYYIGIEASNRSLAAWKRIRSYYILLSFLVVLFSFIASYFFTKSISVPTRKLVEFAKEIEKGNLKKPIKIDIKDEIGILAQNMESMRKSILRKDNQQKVVLAGIAHEIKNPLGGIEMFASIIANETKDVKIEEQAKKVLKESKQIQKILKEFHDFGKPKSSELQECELKQYIVETKELLSKDFESKEIDLDLISENSTVTILFDPGHLRQVLSNLIKNSIQFSPRKGRVRIEVAENGKIILDLKDEGPGISVENREIIFEPFYSSEKNHTGLGLAIVKNLLEENGGTIQVMNSDTGGWIRLTFKKG